MISKLVGPVDTMSDNILYYVGPKQTNIPRAVVPKTLCDQIMKEYHGGSLPGPFSGSSSVRYWHAAISSLGSKS